MRGTLTLSNYNSAHTSCFIIIIYKSYTVATLQYSRPFIYKLRSHCHLRALFAESLLLGRNNVPLLQHHYQALTTYKTYNRVLSEPKNFVTILGSHHQPCVYYGTQIYARSPRGSLGLIKAITNSS